MAKINLIQVKKKQKTVLMTTISQRMLLQRQEILQMKKDLWNCSFPVF